MPWTPPIKRREHPINEKEFFRLLSAECNYIDECTVRDLYFGLVRVVKQELRTKKCARLPQLGDFGLVEQKPRMAWVGKAHALIASREVLRFYPAEYIRRYFNARQGPHHLAVSSDGNNAFDGLTPFYRE